MADTRMIDRNGHRWGATISVVALLIAFVFQAWVVVPVLAAILGVSSAFGLRFSLLGALYRFVKKTLKLSIPIEPEEEAPPRFAQLLGFVFLTLATVFFAISGAGSIVGWTLSLMVAGLQALLGVTGICVGCEIYLYLKKFQAAEQPS